MVWHPPKLSIPASAFEIARRKYQAHHSYGSKDNENDGFHGVTSWSKRIKWHSHSALAFEISSSQYHAHNSHGTKNNENDVFHGVTSL